MSQKIKLSFYDESLIIIIEVRNLSVDINNKNVLKQITT